MWGRGVLDGEHGGKPGRVILTAFSPARTCVRRRGGKGVKEVHSYPTLGHVLSRPSPAQAILATIRSFYGGLVGGDAPQGHNLWLELKKIGDLSPP